jgi:hypothetical protein
MRTRRCLLLLAIGIVLAPPWRAHAQARAFDDAPRSLLDDDPAVATSTSSGWWLGLEAAHRRSELAASETRVGLLLGGVLDAWDRPYGAARAAAREFFEPSPSEPEREPTPATRRPLGALARGAIHAAVAQRAHADFDDLASRARWSGLVPELRVRLAHQGDEGRALAPTEYDPSRVTATGGSTWWVEGRATFRLDRLAFAEEELAVERLRQQRERLDRELADEVLRQFARWQRACAVADDPTRELAARDDAALESAVAEGALDALTGGWFASHARTVAMERTREADVKPRESK